MKNLRFLLAILFATLSTAMMSSGAMAQLGNVGGGFGDATGSAHQYPDLYQGDAYTLSNPDAAGYASIDREILDDYPTIIFSDWGDFVEAIEFEEDNCIPHTPWFQSQKVTLLRL